MTLNMGDGPVANLPAGLDAYAGYNDQSGIGETYPAILTLPARYHMSISTQPGVVANCGDVESGALSSWIGYKVGYCNLANAQGLINRDGRPDKLWTAHYTNVPHICNSSCGFGFTGVADGTQWTDHGGLWDQSLLDDNFFDFLGDTMTTVIEDANKTFIGIADCGGVIALEPAEVAWANSVWGATQTGMPNSLIARMPDIAALQTAIANLTTQVANLTAAVAKIPTTSQPVSLKGETFTGTFD